MSHQPSETLWNRSFLGLIVSQFLAAFNDQATHIVAIFFASDMLVRYVGVSFGQHFLAEKDVISMVTACFIAPFLIFSPLAGPLADRYSKRNILVAWKLAEVAIMALVLCGFLLPHCAGWNILSSKALGVLSAALVILGVFLMGTHSAFFVPAKYGAMPEILHHSILSRGNGLLEGTSFTANILGTVFGGVLYQGLKSTIKDKELIPGSEWVIGATLFLLAIVGAIGSLLIERLPPASPDKKPSFMSNFRVLAKSRSLMVAVAGIAFFAFMTLFMRQVLLAKGEAEKELNQQTNEQKKAESLSHMLGVHSTKKNEDRDSSAPAENPSPETTKNHDGWWAKIVALVTAEDNAELKVATLIGLVGLGVGVGCALAGILSGKKLELGLVLIGSLLLVVTTAALAIAVRSPKTQNSMLICLILIGTAAGIYIVPMYTMLQHRAPKGSKGNLVAMSNFINVAGGFLAIVVFYAMTGILEHFFHLNISTAQVKEHPELRGEYIQQLAKAPTVASVQFLGASAISLGMIFLLTKVRPDFLVRTFFWTRTFGRAHVNPDGLHHLPEFGPLLIVTNDATADDCLHIATSTDRCGSFVTYRTEGEPSDRAGVSSRLSFVRTLSRKLGILVEIKDPTSGEEKSAAEAVGIRALKQAHILVVSIPSDERRRSAAWQLVEAIRSKLSSDVCPVFLEHNTDVGPDAPRDAHLRSLKTGAVLSSETPISAIRSALEKGSVASE